MAKVVKLLDLVSSTVANSNHHQAVYFSSSHLLTYADLATISTAVTQLLHRADAGGEIACVHLDENSHEILLYIPVILAILGTGCAFYFIRDRDRIIEEMDRCGARIIITSVNQSSSYQLETRLGTLYLSTFPSSNNSLPQDTCYLINTSGTSGKSKLVYVTNNSVVHNVIDMKEHFSPSSEDLFFLASPLTFDPHILDIFVSLSAGARLLVLPRTLLTRGDIARDLFINHKVTIMQCTPSMLERMVMGEEEMKTLRVLAVGGEKCSESVRKLLTRMWKQNVSIYHMYGLTEMSVWQVMTKLDTLDLVKDPPVYIEDKNLLTETVVSCGEDKEIIVSSKVRKCWVRGEELCEVKTGDIAYWKGSRLFWEGRRDDVVKVMGKKISLQKVADVLSSKLSTIVVCILGNDGIVHAFVKDIAKACIDNTILLKLAKESLEAKEIPGVFRIVQNIPMTHHGKIDKRKLLSSSDISDRASPHSREESTSKRKEPSPVSPSYDPAITVSLLSSLWVSAVGSAPNENDNFVSCGGDSFSAVALINALNNKIPVPEGNLLETLLSGTYLQLMTLLTRSKPRKEVMEESGVKRTKLFKETGRKEKVKEEVKEVVFKVKGRPSPCSQELLSTSSSCSVTMCSAWSVDMEKCIDSSPLYISGKNVVISCSHSGKVCCVQLLSGYQVWSRHLPDRVESTPTTNNQGEIILVGCYDGSLYCLAVDTGNQLWVFNTGGMVKCSPLVTMEMVIFGSYDHRVYMVKAEDGEKVWSKEVSGSVLASPVMVQNTVLIATLSGEVSAVDPDDGRTAWMIELGHPVFGTPLYTGTSILVPCVNNTLYSISSTGTILWTVTTGGPIFSSPIQLLDRILFGCHDGRVYCVAGGGEVVWTTEVGGGVAGALDWNNREEIVCCSVGGTVNLLSRNGVKIASIELGGEIFSSPLMIDNRVVVGSRDNKLYCILLQYTT